MHNQNRGGGSVAQAARRCRIHSRVFGRGPALSLLGALALAAGCGTEDPPTSGAAAATPLGVARAALVTNSVFEVSGDTFVREGGPDENHGVSQELSVQTDSRHRTLLFFDVEAMKAAVGAGAVLSARIDLFISANPGGWGTGRAIAIHALRQASSEGAATWACASDADTGNLTPDCDAESAWNMSGSNAVAPFAPAFTSAAVIANGTLGVVSFNVTPDVLAIMSDLDPGHGWLIKKMDELAPGALRFASREQGPAARLTLMIEMPDPCTKISDADATCDGRDDDCDGFFDEDFSPGAATCGVGACASTGTQTCAGGVLQSDCAPLAPAADDASCDGVDDDCDGVADEGVVSPCGGCNAECRGGVWGGGSAPFEPSDGLELTGRGELTLAREEEASETVWVPNTAEGTVSKLDARAARELARYATGGVTPERVAVDYRADAWVLERALEGQSSLVKIAGDARRCVDADGAGLVSSQGGQDVLPFGSDECVLLRVPVGEPGELASSLAVDGTRGPDGLRGGNVWVGLERGERMLELHGDTGELLRELPLDDFRPYAAQFDPWGAQWVIDRRGKLLRLGTEAGAEPESLDLPLRCYELESLAIERGGALLLSGFSCEALTHYDPDTGRFRQLSTEGLRTPRGVAADQEQGWVAYTSGELGRVGRSPFALLETLTLADAQLSPFESIAVSTDTLGQVWVVSTFGAPDGVHGVASRLDAESGEVTAQVPVGPGPRGQGDLTGSQRLGWFVPSAAVSRVFEGCGFESVRAESERIGERTEWRAVHVAWVGADGAAVKIEVRHAEQPAGLDAADWIELGTLPTDPAPFELDVPAGGVLEVRLGLSTAGWLGAPRVARVGVQWHCPGPD